MQPGARRCAGIMAGTALLAGLFSGQAIAYQWMTDKPIRNRSLDFAWEFNPESCPSDTREMLHAASDMLDFYTLTGFRIRYSQDTEDVQAVDGRYVLRCSSVLDYMGMGYSFQTAAVTLLSRGHGLITDADVIFNADRLSFDIVLHEFTHVLGLDHSSAPHSIVCHSATPGYCRSKGRLDADDLVGLASLYDVPANCTPFMADDLTLYFPHVNGLWAELKPVDSGDPGKGFTPSAVGASIDYDWRCKLSHTPGFMEVRTEIYHRGKLWEAELLREGGIWYVHFPDEEATPAALRTGFAASAG